MSAYTETLSPEAKSNAQILIQRMKDNGITNPYTQAGILAVVSKESGFIPKRENLNYTASQLMKVFGLPSSLATSLAGNPQKIGDYVYGPDHNHTLGNGVGEGYKYRGAGFNQVTGKSNFKKYGDLVGVDLVSNPDRLDIPSVASDVVIEYFKNGIIALKNAGKLSQYNATNINDFKTTKDSVEAIYHINAGVGHDKEFLDNDVTGGRAKAESRVNDLLTLVGGATTVIKNNMGTAIIGALLAGALIFSLIYYSK